MLTPEYLQRLPDSVVELYAQAEADILADMARRINGFDLFIPSAQYQMERLEEMGALRRDIISKLSGLTGKTRKEIAAIMQEAGVETLSADEKIYQAAGLVGKSELACGEGGAERRTAKDGRPVPQPHKNNSQHGHTAVRERARPRLYAGDERCI